MDGLAEKVKQAQAAFTAESPQPVAGRPCPAPQVLKPVVPPPVAPPPTPATVVAVAEPPAAKKQEKTWVEIVLVDMEGKPMPGVRYRVSLPGGAAQEGQLNAYGQAGFYEIEPGTCKVTFPELDAEAWERG